jgi:hypothetical protein
MDRRRHLVTDSIVRPLAFPCGEGWRAAAQVGDKRHVVSEVSECELQFIRVCAPDRPAVPIPLDQVAHCRNIDADCRRDRHRSAPPLQRVAALCRPQQRLAGSLAGSWAWWLSDLRHARTGLRRGAGMSTSTLTSRQTRDFAWQIAADFRRARKALRNSTLEEPAGRRYGRRCAPAACQHRPQVPRLIH